MENNRSGEEERSRVKFLAPIALMIPALFIAILAPFAGTMPSGFCVSEHGPTSIEVWVPNRFPN